LLQGLQALLQGRRGGGGGHLALLLAGLGQLGAQGIELLLLRFQGFDEHGGELGWA
jgi:hypothetical protein